MKGVKMLGAATIVGAGLALGLAGSAAAQGVGVVTSLQGTANVQRVSTTGQTPQVPLKFRDPVHVQDRITTGDQSLARILLGGRAVVTVREHSSLTITETLGTSTIDITAGKIALTVAKERMGPNERIDIKTPNAVAGVRGTIVITEVGQATAQGGGTPPGSITTRFTLLTGLLEVALLDPSTGRPGPTRFTLNPLQTLSFTGFAPPPGGPRTLTQAQGRAAANNYRVNLKDAPQGSHSQITDRQVEQAGNAAAATGAGGSGTGNGVTIINKTNNQPPVQKPTDPVPGCGNSCTSVTPHALQNLVTTITTPPPPPPECRSICEGFRARGR